MDVGKGLCQALALGLVAQFASSVSASGISLNDDVLNRVGGLGLTVSSGVATVTAGGGTLPVNRSTGSFPVNKNGNASFQSGTVSAQVSQDGNQLTLSISLTQGSTSASVSGRIYKASATDPEIIVSLRIDNQYSSMQVLDSVSWVAGHGVEDRDATTKADQFDLSHFGIMFQRLQCPICDGSPPPGPAALRWATVATALTVVGGPWSLPTVLETLGACNIDLAGTGTISLPLWGGTLEWNGSSGAFTLTIQGSVAHSGSVLFNTSDPNHVVFTGNLDGQSLAGFLQSHATEAPILYWLYAPVSGSGGLLTCTAAESFQDAIGFTDCVCFGGGTGGCTPPQDCDSSKDCGPGGPQSPYCRWQSTTPAPAFSGAEAIPVLLLVVGALVPRRLRRAVRTSG